MARWDNRTTEELLEAFVSLKNRSEAKQFLRDLLTEQEIIEFGKRWKTARMLSKNVPYSKIAKETGLSSTTIARISRWLNKGMGGYELMIKRLVNDHHRNLTLVRRE